MTDTDLNIAIAERKGWTEVAPGHDGRLMGVPPGEKLLGYVPDWKGDPREWAKLLEEMRGQVWCMYPKLTTWLIDVKGGGCIEAPTLGRAVAEAWLACNQETPNRPEGKE